ncbi:MAG: YihY/virulence factor BrkB family protein [Syntrophales bacterium]|nr:YihY/virulence factor BrkB family protein [Syntrophales bacterium]
MLRETFSRWLDDNVPRLSAALAYYTVFSLAPLLVLAVSVAGFVFGEQAAKGELFEGLTILVGRNGALFIQDIFARTSGKLRSGILASLMAIFLLFIGASSVFAELRSSLNQIWGVQNKKGGGLKEFFIARLLSFSMVLVVGFVLLLSLVTGTVISTLSSIAPEFAVSLFLIRTADAAVSLGLVTVLFAMLYKILPGARVSWRDVWLASLVTSFLFTVGRIFIGIYLGRSGVGSIYGAASSLALLLLWIYYSAQIFFFGAELSRVYAERYGSRKKVEKAG